MRRFALVALLASACASTPPQRDYTQAIDASRKQMEVLVAKEKIPTATIAVTAGDHIVWHDTFGGATIHTRFRGGSLTKLVTAAALMRLVDQHRVSLDDPVSKFLPDFLHGEITLRQLAGHLSGIRHYTNDEFLNKTRYTSATDSLRKFANAPLLSKPGEKYFYSSYGYDVLGAVIERATGKHFTEAVSALVFRPLQMNETTFADDANSATLFDLGKNGPEPSPETDLSDRLPAGAIVTTARDFARFLIAMSGGNFLTNSSRATMFATQSTSDEKPTNVGIAWRIAIDDAQRTFLHHGGAVTGGRGVALVYPKERVSVIILTNLGFARFNERDAGEIARRFLP
ncbi:MAG: hypothetical protein DMF56_05580 [Acidobacteria bacterium]|nr:MAG: hypothetical protein DMF56_05580 [Acidobacteriota bacterium]